MNKAASPVIRKQGPWSLWWLVLITLGIYYLVWYHRVNRELAALSGQPMATDGNWFSQIIPIYGIIGLHKTAQRVNDAHTSFKSSTRISPVVTWLIAPAWFGSHTRYVQRRMNTLREIVASHS